MVDMCLIDFDTRLKRHQQRSAGRVPQVVPTLRQVRQQETRAARIQSLPYFTRIQHTWRQAGNVNVNVTELVGGKEKMKSVTMNKNRRNHQCSTCL